MSKHKLAEEMNSYREREGREGGRERGRVTG